MIQQLTSDISYLRHTEDPFSADSFIITENNTFYIFDVGSNPDFISELNALNGRKTIILSHFHPDHCANLPSISYETAYGSRETMKHYDNVTLIETELLLTSDIIARNIPSSHSKNALSLQFREYLFVGDALCSANGKHNVQKLNELIRFLEVNPAKYLIISHDDQPLQEKDQAIRHLKEIYSRREKNNPFIMTDGYFH